MQQSYHSRTPPEVDGGVDFAEACKILAAEHQAGPRPWASWGDYDRHQFTRQCQAAGVAYPFGAKHINAKAVFTTARGLKKRPGMAQALKLADLPLEGRPRPARTPCVPAPPTSPAPPSRTSRASTPRATFSAPSSGIRCG
ncbi:hypothetical protein [Amycolatopsis sp. NPDC059657]|uniref:hypothetical protein n=1 Tax=Amycolatopsis sp. NPDC059657 TaxID=3346899 RepID=UPI00366CA16F